MRDYAYAADKCRRKRLRIEFCTIVVMILMVVGVLAIRRSVQNDITAMAEYYEAVIAGQERRIEQLEHERGILEEALSRRIRQVNSLLDEMDEMRTVLDWDARQMTITHYAPLDPSAIEGVCYSGDPSITASGATVEPGITVAAGRNIPFGTRIFIPGYGYREVQDRGGAIGPNNIDIAVASRSRAFELGRVQQTVYVEVMH